MSQLVLKKKNELLTNKKKGFTLVELIIVIAIIAILAAMAIPKFSAVRLDAKVSNDVAAAKNISTITATLIANGTIPSTGITNVNLSSTLETDKISAQIRDRLEGTAKNGKGEASGQPFLVTVGTDESITVTCYGAILYPEQDKEHYTIACKTGTAYVKPSQD